MDSQAIARYEYKYGVTADQAEAIRRRLRPYCTMDEHSVAARSGFYVIDSLYFDNAQYRCFHDGEQKAPRRVKLRVRAYGEPHAPIVKFEVKRRLDDLVVKSSAVTPRENWSHWFSREPRRDIPVTGAMHAFLTTGQALDLRPKMLVRYERQAFRSAIDHYVRITFDRRMRYQPMHAYNLESDRDRWASMDDAGSMGGARSTILMELKFITAAPSWLVDLVRQFGLMRQGYSKYGSAVRRDLFETRLPRDLAATSYPRRLPWTA